MIPFGEWLPDQPDYQNSANEARNVIPGARGYRSMSGISALSSAASAQILSVYPSIDGSGNIDLFAATDDALLQFNGATSALDDVTNSSATTGYNNTTSVVTFTQFGTKVIAAVGHGYELQVWDTTSSTEFADLDTGVAPNAKYVASVRDFVFAANLSTDQTKVQWCALDDPTDWTASATTQADSQVLPDGGRINGLHGGERAVILCERAIYVGTYVGAPVIFQFDRVINDKGCAYPRASTQLYDIVYFLSPDGFEAFDGRSVRPIGHERVNNWFYENLNDSFTNNIVAAADPKNELITWAFPSGDSPDGSCDTLLMYNYTLDRWSYAKVDTYGVFPLFTPGYTLEQVDNISSSLDALGISLDDPSLRGGQLSFGAATTSNEIGVFSGALLEGVVETGEWGDPAASLLSECYVYTDGNNPTISVRAASRYNTQDAATYGTASSINSDGFAPLRSNGRFHRIECTLTGDQWRSVQGVDVTSQRRGKR